jgi:hypothetical protein
LSPFHFHILLSFFEERQRVPFAIDKGLAGGDQVILVINYFDIVTGGLLGTAELPSLGSEGASRRRGRYIGNIHVQGDGDGPV